MTASTRFLVIMGVVCLLFIVGNWVVPGFLSATQVTNQLKIAAFLGLFGLCQTVAMAAGGQGLDLSVGAAATLGGIVGTAVFAGYGNALAFLAAAGAGLLMGAVNGIGVAVLQIPPLVATIAVASVVDGALILWVSQANPPNMASEMIVQIAGRTYHGIPSIAVVWAVFTAAALWLLMTVWGRRLRATGSNATTAYLSGTNIRTIRVAAYAISGFVASVTGLLLTGYVSHAFLGLGNAYILASVVVAVIGGVALEGGRTPYLGVIGAAILLTVLISLLTAVQVVEAERQLVLGFTLLAYLMLDRSLKRR
jgi:ribose transport system permease protein